MLLPNIIILIADQWRFDAVGFQNPLVHTPNIDSLQKNSCVFDNAFCASPVCTPSRAALLTGRYPQCTGAWNIGTSLNEDEDTLPDYLKSLGYYSAAVGKTHLRPQLKGFNPKDICPPEIRDRGRQRDNTYYGFDYTCITEDDKIGAYNDYVVSQGYPSPLGQGDEGKGEDGINPIPEELHQTYWVGMNSTKVIGQHDFSKPLFLWSSFVDPHHPFDPIAKFAELYQNTPIPEKIPMGNIKENRPAHLMKQDGAYWPGGGEEHRHTPEEITQITRWYYAMVSFIDQEIGKIIQALKERGQWDNTIIVLTSDHGEHLGDHGLLKKGPFMYDTIIKVPLLMHGKNIKAGHISGPTENIDILPTLLELLGQEKPAAVQGKSLAHCLLEGKESPRTSAVITYDAHDRGIIAKTLRTQSYKLTLFMGESYGELFDLQTDPRETHNYWFDSSYADIKNRLILQLTQRLLEDFDPLPPRTAQW